MSTEPDDPTPLFEWILERLKTVHAEGQGFKIMVKQGDTVLQGEIVPQPISGGSGGYRRQRQPLDLEKAKAVVTEYQDLLTEPEDAGAFWFVGTKTRLGDKYDEINTKLRAAGFRYERWVKDQKHTGGWKGQK